MNRRHVIGMLGGAAAFPLVARAQTLPVIGALLPETHDTDTPRFRAFHEGLKEAGFVVGRNVAIEYRFANGQIERWPALAADLVARPVAVIASLGGLRTVSASKTATTTIPIVFQGGFDPVAMRIVASLGRPGANITGVSTLNADLGPKRLELLKELVPAAKVVAVLINPTNPNAEIQLREIRAAARSLGVEIAVVRSSAEVEFEATFGRIAEIRADGLLITNAAPFNGRSSALGALSLRHRVPTIFHSPEFATAGGFVSYGASTSDAFRLAGLYVGRILKGDKPAELAVQQVSKVEMIINLKTAKALGINVSLPLLGRADEVIE